MAGPGKALHLRGDDGIETDRFGQVTLDQAAGGNFAGRIIGHTAQRAQGAVQVANRRREAPNAQIGSPSAQPSQCQFRLRAALGRH